MNDYKKLELKVAELESLVEELETLVDDLTYQNAGLRDLLGEISRMTWDFS